MAPPLRNLILIAGLFIATALGWTDRAYEATVGRALIDQNDSYLEQALEQSTKVLVTVALLKGSVDVVEGSSLLGIEVGDIMQPALDYLELAWKVVIVSTITLLCLKYALPGSIVVGQGFLLVALAIFAAEMLRRLFVTRTHIPEDGAEQPAEKAIATPSTLQRYGSFTLLLAATFYFILPASITLSSALEPVTTATLRADYEVGLEKIKVSIRPEGLLGVDDIMANNPRASRRGDGILDSVAQTLSQLQATVELSAARVHNWKQQADKLFEFMQNGGAELLTRTILLICVVYILEGILFPLGAFFLVFWLVKQMKARAFGSS